MRFRRPAAITVLVLLLAAGLGLPTASAAEAPHPAQQQNTTRTFTAGESSATLGSRTVLLNSTDITALDHTSGNTLTVQHRTANLDLVGVGSKLLGQTSPEFPQGIMYSVTAVSNTPGGASTYTVTPAPLSEVFTDLNVHASRTLNLKTATLAGPNANGCTLSPTSLDCNVELGSDKISAGTALPKNLSVEAKHRVTARFSANLNPKIDISASTTQVSTTFAVAPTMAMDVNADMELEVSRSWQIPGLDFPPIDIQIGPVPIIVVPKLELELKAAGTVSAGLGLHYGFSQAFSAGMVARAGGGVSVTKTVTKPSFTHSETLSGKGSLKFSLAFTLYAQIDELAGPTLTFEPGIKLTINPFASGKKKKNDWWWTLEGTGSFSIGGKISILGKVLAEGKYQLWANSDNQFILAHAGDKTPYVGVTDVAGFGQVRANSGRFPLTAHTKGNTGALTWRLDSNSTNAHLATCVWAAQCKETLATVGNTTYFVTPLRSVGAYTLTVTPQRGQSKHVTIMVLPGDPKIPTVPLGLRATPKMDAADISWKAPATDNFAEIDSYTLSATSPGRQTRTITVPGGNAGGMYSTRITHLGAAHLYTVKVKAHNRMGFSPTVATTVTPLGRLRTNGDLNVLTPNSTNWVSGNNLVMSGNGAVLLACLPGNSSVLPAEDKRQDSTLIQTAYTVATKQWRRIDDRSDLGSCDAHPSITTDGTTALYLNGTTLYKYNLTTRTRSAVPTPISGLFGAGRRFEWLRESHDGAFPPVNQA